jgi:UDP-glucose 4-epimerase
MTVMLAGGAGYIGSHTCVEFLQNGDDIVVFDNLSNSSQTSLERVAEICGRSVAFEQGDIRDKAAVLHVLKKHKCDLVVHFAGLKSVNESVADPLHYFDVNVGGTVKLLEAMAEAGVKRLIFSSTAAVYGQPQYLPFDEKHPLAPTTPYGESKLMVERILEALCVSDPEWSIAQLRYFNPVGAHESGLIGEDPQDVPNNLMPYVAQVAMGQRPHLAVYGDDYDTPDGTGVRDFIHVVDLARGHMKCAAALARGELMTINLGTGEGHSVLELVSSFKRASNRQIPYKIEDRRPGDVATSFADPRLAEEKLGWKAEKGLFDMCRDSWNWVSKNPTGYRAE